MNDFSKLMEDSLNSNTLIRNQAEQTIKSLIIDTDLLELFFNYIANNSVDYKLKQAAAVTLMRYIGDYWYDDSQPAMENPQKVLKEDTKQLFKGNIIQLMLTCDQTIMPTLKQMIILIVQNGGGFLNCWPELMTVFAGLLAQKNYGFSLDFYHLIRKVIKRYQIEFKSVPLFEEIKNTLKELAPILTEDAVACSNFLFSSNKDTREMAIPYMTMFRHILNIFYSLNYQDFPEFFEDNLNTWINILKSGIDFNLKIPSGDHSFLAEMIKVKTTAMKCWNLYFNNYFDDIAKYSDDFPPLVWNVVMMIKTEEVYSKLVRELLDYYRIFFQYRRGGGFQLDAIQHLITNLIIPNMKLTSKEQDDFEENPVNFLKIELEEADMESNKYHAINLLKHLINIYPEVVNSYIKPLINSLLESYHTNPSKHWNDKIIAINLIFATMIKTFAQRIGATELKVDPSEITGLIEVIFIKEFTSEIAKPQLIARIYSMKFLTTFRLQIPQQWLCSVIDMLVNILNNSDHVIQNACLLTLEKILFMKDLNSNVSLVIDAVNVEQTFYQLVESLVKFSSFSINIFAMRCLFRTIFLTNEAYYKAIIESLSSSMNNILKLIIASPTEDQFNYFFFETIALIMRKLATFDFGLYSYFEAAIKDNIMLILSNSISDLMGYAFQILALELNLTPQPTGEGLPADSIHTSLIKTIIFDEVNWSLQMKYLFNPFLSYIKASLLKNKTFFDQNAINQTFKIAEKLLGLKSYSLVFELLDDLMNFFEMSILYENIKVLVYNFLLTYGNLKTTNRRAYRDFGKHLLVFFSKIVIKTSAKGLIELIESVSEGSTVGLLSELSDLLVDLENSKMKKLVTYAYCAIISTFFSQFDLATLRLFTYKLISHLEKFYKLSTNIFSDGEKDQQQDPSYAANNYNKLLNAETKIDYAEYQSVYQIDENQMFFSTMSTVKNNQNINLIGEVYDTLSSREKEYLQTTAKKYNYN